MLQFLMRSWMLVEGNRKSVLVKLTNSQQYRILCWFMQQLEVWSWWWRKTNLRRLSNRQPITWWFLTCLEEEGAIMKTWNSSVCHDLFYDLVYLGFTTWPQLSLTYPCSYKVHSPQTVSAEISVYCHVSAFNIIAECGFVPTFTFIFSAKCSVNEKC